MCVVPWGCIVLQGPRGPSLAAHSTSRLVRVSPTCPVVLAALAPSCTEFPSAPPPHEWRKGFNMEYVTMTDPDELLGCTEEEILYFWPQTRLPHTDKDSRPVYLEKTGCIDVTGLLSVSNMDRLVQWHVQCTEVDSGRLFREITAEVADGSRKLSKGATTVTQGTNILDLENFSMGMFMGESKEYLGRISKISQDYYPETMGKMFIVNAPMIFTTVWSVVKGWLDPRTVAKIGLYGGPSEYKEKLFEQLGGADKTPVEYGGTWKRPGGGPLFSASVKSHMIEKQSSFTSVVPIKKGQRFVSRWWADADGVTFSVQWVPGATEDPKDASVGEMIFAKKEVTSCTGSANVTGVKHCPSADEAEEGDHLGVYVVQWQNNHKGGYFSSGSRTITYCALAKSIKCRGQLNAEAREAAAAASGGAAGAEGTAPSEGTAAAAE